MGRPMHVNPYLDPLAAQYPGRAPHEDGGGGADLLVPLDGGAAEVHAHSRLGDPHRERVVVAADLKDGIISVQQSAYLFVRYKPD